MNTLNQRRFRQVCAVVIRSIPLFVLDAILRSKYHIMYDLTALSFYTLTTFGLYNGSFQSQRYYTDINEISHSVALAHFVTGILMTAILLFYPLKLLCLILLSSSYVLLFSASCMLNENYISHYMHLIHQNTNVILELYFVNKSMLIFFFMHFFARLFFTLFTYFSFHVHSNFRRFIMCLHLNLPLILSFLTPPAYILIALTRYCSVIEGTLTVTYIFTNYKSIVSQFVHPLHRALYYMKRDGIANYVLSCVVEIRLWKVFRTFWIIRILISILILLYNSVFLESKESATLATINSGLIFVIKHLLCENCNTFIAVVGMACTFSTVMTFILKWICKLLLSQPRLPNNFRCTIMFVFLALAIQSDLTVLLPNERLLRLYYNVIIIFDAVVQIAYKGVGLCLISLNRAGNQPLNKHIKMLIVVAVFFTYPCSMITFLLTMHSFSPWLFASLVFNIDIIVQIITSLIIYFLYGIDLRKKDTWENLHRYVFYASFTRRIFAFLCSVFLFFNGLYTLFYESLVIARILLLFMHLYVNVYFQLKNSVKIFCRRQKATKAINSLKEATEHQLIILNDRCTICFHHLYCGKVTKCNHYFHEGCLRNWLNEQSVCPICHRDIFLDAFNQNVFDHEHQE